jgi:hypothetical protein
MPSVPKALELNHPNCIDQRACEGAALEPTRQRFGICGACMQARTAGVPARPHIPGSPFTASFSDSPPARPSSVAVSRARGSAASAKVNRGKRKNQPFVINAESSAKAKAHGFDSEPKRTKPKRMREPKVESGLQVIGVRFIGKRAGKGKAA